MEDSTPTFRSAKLDVDVDVEKCKRRSVEELAGKVCVITGGAGGIGLAMARRFRRAGMFVVLGDVDQSALDRAIDDLGDGSVGAVCDVTSPGSMDTLRDAAVQAFGDVHVVCLNAGVAPVGSLLETELDTWRWVIDVNVLGVVHGIRSFAPLLVERGEGHIVFTSSAAGLSTTPAIGAYSATKHAVVGIATTLRDELAPAGVGVSVICPGALRTQIFDSERNRPGGVPDVPSSPDGMASLYQRAVANAPDPSVAAEAAYRAVVEDLPFVLPSPEVNVAIEARIDAIRAALG